LACSGLLPHRVCYRLGIALEQQHRKKFTISLR
jgi:hypothetical protein